MRCTTSAVRAKSPRRANETLTLQPQLGFRILISAIAAGVLAVASGGLALWANNARQTAKELGDEQKTLDDEHRSVAKKETRRAPYPATSR